MQWKTYSNANRELKKTEQRSEATEQSTELNRQTKSIESTDRSQAEATDQRMANLSWLSRFVYWALAGFFFALAMVGVILPGIPTTPFLLLMCYFLIRVSPKLHARVLNWPMVGKPLRDWREHRGVSRSVKNIACTMVLVCVTPTFLWGGLPQAIKLLILCLAMFGISVIVRLPTVGGKAGQLKYTA